MVEPKQIREMVPLFPKQYAKYQPSPLPEGIIRGMEPFFREHVKHGDFKTVRNELVDNPRYIPIALTLLSKRDSVMFVNAAIALCDLPAGIVERGAVIDAVYQLYNDGKPNDRKNILSSLNNASSQINIAPFMPLVFDATSIDDANVRVDAVSALLKTAGAGGIILFAIPTLIGMIFDPEPEIREMLQTNLWQLDIRKASAEQRAEMVGALLSLINSPAFMQEAETNSVAFVEQMKKIQSFIEQLKAQPEMKEAV